MTTYVWQELHKANRNHHICEVFDTLNPSDSAIHSRYFDGTQSAALKFFASLPEFKKYMGNDRYDVVVRANSITLNYKNQ